MRHACLFIFLEQSLSIRVACFRGVIRHGIIHDDIMSEDKEMLQDMILVAINQAIENVDKISKEKMGSLTGGMNIQGLF